MNVSCRSRWRLSIPEVALFWQIVLELTQRWMQSGYPGSIGQIFVAERVHGNGELLRGGHRRRRHLRRILRITTRPMYNHVEC